MTHFMGILPIILSFSGESVADSYHDNPLFSVHLGNNIARANRNINRIFSKPKSVIHILSEQNTLRSIFNPTQIP